MRNYQKRLLKEQEDLYNKIVKLDNFLKNHENDPKVSKEEYSLLSEQFNVMYEYNEILLERIKLFKGA